MCIPHGDIDYCLAIAEVLIRVLPRIINLGALACCRMCCTLVVVVIGKCTVRPIGNSIYLGVL